MTFTALLLMTTPISAQQTINSSNGSTAPTGGGGGMTAGPLPIQDGTSGPAQSGPNCNMIGGGDDGGGLFGTIANIAVQAAAAYATGGASLAVTAATTAAGVGANAATAGGQQQGGGTGKCFVERQPFSVEDKVAAANKPATVDASAPIVAGTTNLKQVTLGPAALAYDPAEADTQYQATYPTQIQAQTGADVQKVLAEQEGVARGNSRQLLASSAQIMTDVEDIVGQIQTLVEAGLQCPGVTCSDQVSLQVQALNASLIQKQMMLQAVAARTAATHNDMIEGSRQRQQANLLLDWKDFPGFDAAAAAGPAATDQGTVQDAAAVPAARGNTANMPFPTGVPGM